MKVLGNINALKKSIEQTYSDKIKAIDNETKEKVAEINSKAKKEMDEKVSKMQLDTESEVSKTYSRLISEETMTVKKQYEEKREAYINEIFDEAEKQAATIAHSDGYLKLVKSKAPKGKFDIVADSTYYEKEFSGLKTSKEFHGLKFVSAEVTYDFSIESSIASKRDVLRHIINEKLFK